MTDALRIAYLRIAYVPVGNPEVGNIRGYQKSNLFTRLSFWHFSLKKN